MSLRFAWLIILPALALSQEEAGEIETPKRLEWSGNLDVKYSVFHMVQSSPIYRLQFYNKDVSPYLSQYRLEPYLNAEYRIQDLGFQLRTHATYYSDNESSFDVFEAYGSYSPSINFTTQAGKKVYNWGKGYAFNPAGFVNPVKDPENPELAQAGLLSINAEYIKSFSSEALQSFSAQLVVIPQSPSVNSRFSETKNTDFAVKFSFLLWDTDIDFITYQSSLAPKQYGLDLSTNLLENLEVHAEFSVAKQVSRYVIVNGILQSDNEEVTSYLFGIRYLNEWNATVIAEYYHNGFGLMNEEYRSYRDFLLGGLAAGTPAAIQQTLATSQTYFKSNTLMRDYLYLKVIQPEPFDWLYFTPSVFTIYNLSDKSFLLSASLNYKPVTNLELIFWPSLLIGGNATEFGDRQAQQRVELWMRVFF
ncbi:MAG: hypothetical protein HYY49_07475 [Ignavibacteriales bacterium]|nr:hypothetical protein [Ignavibacteriales bacterium]